MDYQNTLKYLYESAPMFQQLGGKAYKEGLENTLTLDEHFGHPHKEFHTIHVGGTNGKGSVSHTLAAILQAAGYRVGLYTSPHLVDFRERIRINGKMMPESYVIDFVEKHRLFFEPLYPSFFELTTAMAFRYFADNKVDVAVIEVGLGGRLDCTNIIRPNLSIITNISFDHMQFLGDTLEKIATEKAGIIKDGTPILIGIANEEEVKNVFIRKAEDMNAPIYFAGEVENSFMATDLINKAPNDIQYSTINSVDANINEKNLFARKEGMLYMGNIAIFPGIIGELTGLCQKENARTIFAALPILIDKGYKIKKINIEKGFGHVCKMTGLMGRWQKLQEHPTLVCDTGHNVAGIALIVKQLNKQSYNHLHIVFGMVNDKDINNVLQILPKDATYYFTKGSVKRALPEEELWNQATKAGLKGNTYPSVVDAIRAAQVKSLPEDFIFVGGSSFIVADLLANRHTLNLD